MINLIYYDRGIVNAFIANIDEVGQSLRDGHLGRKAAAKMIMDLLSKAKNLRGSLNGLHERCKIALNNDSQ